MFVRIPILLLTLAFIGSSTLFGQEERYELGKRLQRFEIAWQTASPERRKLAVEPMQSAVQNFFGLQLKAAASKLDGAYFAVRPEPATDFEKYAAPQSIRVDKKLTDITHPTVNLTLEPFYGKPIAAPADGQVKLTIYADSNAMLLEKEIAISEFSPTFALDLSSISAGDYKIVPELVSGNERFQLNDFLISRVENLESRIAEVSKIIVERDKPPVSRLSETSRNSTRQWLQILKSQRDAVSLETDYPSNQLLTMCETMLANPDAATDYLRELAVQQDLWLNLSHDKKQNMVRMRAPANISQPMPLLFVFHGAGGSENMFFETYGAGRTISMAIERGWVVVAPRQGVFGLSLSTPQMIDVISEFFPIDRDQIYFMGHSMGASQVIRQVTTYPQVAKAAVAIGGGGRIAKTESIRQIPWYIAAGEQDFGKSGAAALYDSLKKDSIVATYREFPDVEHMVIVQAALDEAFAFLDTLRK